MWAKLALILTAIRSIKNCWKRRRERFASLHGSDFVSSETHPTPHNHLLRAKQLRLDLFLSCPCCRLRCYPEPPGSFKRWEKVSLVEGPVSHSQCSNTWICPSVTAIKQRAAMGSEQERPAWKQDCLGTDASIQWPKSPQNRWDKTVRAHGKDVFTPGKLKTLGYEDKLLLGSKAESSSIKTKACLEGNLSPCPQGPNVS